MHVALSAPPVWVRASLAWVLLSNAADLVLTLWGIDLGRIAEANPIMAPILAANPQLAIVLKVFLAAGGVMALYWAYPRRPRFTGAAVGFISLVMLWVMYLHGLWILA